MMLHRYPFTVAWLAAAAMSELGLLFWRTVG